MKGVRNEKNPIRKLSLYFSLIILVSISVPAMKVNSIPPNVAINVIQSVAYRRPRFPKIAPNIISIIATANPSLNEIKLDTKIIITNINMLNWVISAIMLLSPT